MRIVKICTIGVQRLDWQIVIFVRVVYIRVHANDRNAKINNANEHIRILLISI